MDNSNGVENAIIIMNTIKKKFRNIMIILKILLNNYYFDLIQNGKYRKNDIQFLKYFLKYYAFKF